MSKSKSKKLGRLDGWDGYVVYEALTDLGCEVCGKPVKRGDRFIRKKVSGFGNKNWVTCKDCLEAA